MGDWYGLGDGMHDLGSSRALAESKAAEARARRPSPVEADRWVSVGTVLRILGLAFLGVVLAGWVLTALNW